MLIVFFKIFDDKMNVELLRRDELLVELEVRGLSDPSKGVVTSELKNALAKRLRAEEEYSLSIPWDPHVAAAERPEQEVAILLQKLHAVQQYLLKEIRAGKTMAEMYPQVATRMIHVRGRIDRSKMCPIFNPRSTRLHVVMKMLGRMVVDLHKGVVAAGDVAERLSRVVIKIDRSSNEDDGSSCEEVTTGEEEEDEAKVEEEEVNKREVVEAEQEEDTTENDEDGGAETEKEEEVQENEEENEEAEDNGEDEGSSKEVVKVDRIRDEVVEEIDEADVKASEEVSEEEEEDDAKDEEDDVGKGKEDEKADEEEDSREIFREDQVVDVTKSDELWNSAVSNHAVNSSTQTGVEDFARQVGHLGPKSSGFKMKGSGRRARNSLGTLWPKAGAGVRLKRLSDTRKVAQCYSMESKSIRRIRRIHVWIQRYAVRALTYVDLLVEVLDLRLVYEILAKENRRVAYAVA